MVDVVRVLINAADAVVSTDLLLYIGNTIYPARLILPHYGVLSDFLALARHHTDIHDRTSNLNNA